MNLKKTILFIVVFFSLSYKSAQCQPINWASLKDQHKYIVSAHAGFDYAFTYGMAYSYALQTRIPVLLNVDLSTSMGEKILDDFKTKIGSQIRLYEVNNFQFSASVYGIYRRYENSLVRLQNFGSEMNGLIGYFKPKWFAALEFGFDKAIVTNFKHSNVYKDDFPEVKDGWYQPATGGNFKYGLQVGYSFKCTDVILKAGSVVTQNFKTKPTLPFYGEVIYNFKIGK